MKSVLVCAAQARLVTGGAEVLVRELAAQLGRRGFRVDVVALPFHGHPPSEVVRQALAWRLLELRETDGRAFDLVIPTKFPSYLVRSPRKVAWLFHQHREAYDLLGTPRSSFTDRAEDRLARGSILAMDRAALAECERVFAASEYGWPRLLRLRVYYDGSSTPSVDAPLGDFFAVGHGFERPVRSLMVRASSEGRSRNSYSPMPFRRSCRITVTNEGRRRVANLYYHVDWQKLPALPEGTPYFHAWYRQALPAPPDGSPYEILMASAAGASTSGP